MLNYYQYRLDTDNSNKQGTAIWFKAYDALSEYGMKDISAQSMSNLAYELGKNDTLWKRFEYNWYNGVYHDGGLDRNGTVCDLLTATSEQYDDCRKNLFLSDIDSKEFETRFW